MKFLRVMIGDLKLNIKSLSFILAVLITTILCFTSTLYVDEGNVEYSIISVLSRFDINMILNSTSFSRTEVMSIGLYSKLFMFTTIIVSFPFIQSNLNERVSGFKRSAIIRIGINKYHISKILTSMITGGLVILSGYVIFCGIIVFLFPSINKYDQLIKDNYFFILGITHGQPYVRLYNFIGEIALVIPNFIGIFLYGAFATIPTIMLMAIIRNKYLLACIPFIFKYIADMITNKSLINSYQSGQLSYLSNLYIYNLKLENLQQILFVEKPISILLVYSSVFATAVLFYLIIINRRIDYGA